MALPTCVASHGSSSTAAALKAPAFASNKDATAAASIPLDGAEYRNQVLTQEMPKHELLFIQEGAQNNPEQVKAWAAMLAERGFLQEGTSEAGKTGKVDGALVSATQAFQKDLNARNPGSLSESPNRLIVGQEMWGAAYGIVDLPASTKANRAAGLEKLAPRGSTRSTASSLESGRAALVAKAPPVATQSGFEARRKAPVVLASNVGQPVSSSQGTFKAGNLQVSDGKPAAQTAAAAVGTSGLLASVAEKAASTIKDAASSVAGAMAQTVKDQVAALTDDDVLVGMRKVLEEQFAGAKPEEAFKQLKARYGAMANDAGFRAQVAKEAYERAKQDEVEFSADPKLWPGEMRGILTDVLEEQFWAGAAGPPVPIELNLKLDRALHNRSPFGSLNDAGRRLGGTGADPNVRDQIVQRALRIIAQQNMPMDPGMRDISMNDALYAAMR